MARDLFADRLIPEREQAANEGLSTVTKRLHRRQGSRQTVDGIETGVDVRGFAWIRLGKRVFYVVDRVEKRLDTLCRKAGGRYAST